MKKIIFALLMIVMTTFAITATSSTANAGTAKIDRTIKSKEGTVIHIKGTLKYTLCCPPSIDEFHGTITITDKNGNTTVNTFSANVDTNPDFTAAPNSQDVCHVSAVMWVGGENKDAMDALNSTESNQLLSSDFNAAGGCQ